MGKNPPVVDYFCGGWIEFYWKPFVLICFNGFSNPLEKQTTTVQDHPTSLSSRYPPVVEISPLIGDCPIQTSTSIEGFDIAMFDYIECTDLWCPCCNEKMKNMR